MLARLIRAHHLCCCHLRLSIQLTNYRKRRWKPPQYVELSVRDKSTAAAAGAELLTAQHFNVPTLGSVCYLGD